MRVALVLPGLDYGGAERMVEELALAVAQHGHAKVIATTRGGPVADRLIDAGVPVEVLGLASPFDARVPLRLRRVLRDFRPGVVHSHLAVADIATAVAGIDRPCPHWITMHNAGIELGPGKRSLWRWALRRSDARFAVAAHIAQRWGPAELVHPSFVSPAASLDSEHRARRKASLGLGTQPLILSLGRRTPIKGVDVMAAASEQLPSTIRWLHYGPGAPPDPPGRIEWRPPRPDVATVLAGADLFVQASRSEGFPQATLEAMWSEVPVVVTPVGGTRELVQTDGLYVPTDDPDALAAGILRVLSGAVGRERARQARDRLEAQRLTREGMLEAYLERYGRI
ncbi:MAG: glycosyltransferase [Myxococcota bacterium]